LTPSFFFFTARSAVAIVIVMTMSLELSLVFEIELRNQKIMLISLRQVAARQGKSVRQIRYLIQQGKLAATKIEGRWMIDTDELPRSAGKRDAEERKQRQLRGLVEEALEVGDVTPRRYSVLDLKAFQIALPLYRQARQQLGEEHPATGELRRALARLSQGCHRYDKAEKAQAYREARDAASQAVCELVLSESSAGEELLHAIEQELMASLAGLLRRLDRRRVR
jgi:hypothetical protein